MIRGTSFVAGREAKIRIGAFTCVNGAYLICNQEIRVGDHCLVAWGTVITDTWAGPDDQPAARRRILESLASDPLRPHPSCSDPRPVVLEDNVWVGFDAVVLPGTHVGRGSVIGCKSVVGGELPPYAVAVGNPARIIRYLDHTDSPAARAQALQECVRD